MGAVAFFVGLILLGLVIMFKEDRDKTNICNKIYRKLVDRGGLEHLTPSEWGALERYILEKWKYASEQYRKSFFGRADARKEYGDEQSDEERHCSEHEIDWSRSEPDVWGSHPIHFDDESYQKWVEQWREEMQRNRFSARFKNLLREKHVDNPDVYRRANIDRKLFSKIISKESYVPGKSTVLALAVALKLDLSETRGCYGGPVTLFQTAFFQMSLSTFFWKEVSTTSTKSTRRSASMSRRYLAAQCARAEAKKFCSGRNCRFAGDTKRGVIVVQEDTSGISRTSARKTRHKPSFRCMPCAACFQACVFSGKLSDSSTPTHPAQSRQSPMSWWRNVFGLYKGRALKALSECGRGYTYNAKDVLRLLLIGGGIARRSEMEDFIRREYTSWFSRICVGKQSYPCAERRRR